MIVYYFFNGVSLYSVYLPQVNNFFVEAFNRVAPLPEKTWNLTLRQKKNPKKPVFNNFNIFNSKVLISHKKFTI